MTDDGRRLELLVARTERLHGLTARLSAALHASEVAQIAVDESAAAFEMKSAALWRTDGDHLVLERAHNYPEAALDLVRTLPLDRGRPLTDAVVRKEPIWIATRAEYDGLYPSSGARVASIVRGGYALAAIPILLGERVLGALALTFDVEHEFDADERRFLMMLALHCAQAFERVRLHDAETRMREAETERATFLAKASALLGNSLDYQETLRNVAALAVPRIGDWCGVELLDGERGTSTQVAVAHVDPAKIRLAYDLRDRYPPDAAARTGVPNVLRTGQSELYVDITDEMLAAGAVDAEHLRILRNLGLTSAMSVAIKDRGAIVGAITFILSTSARRYTEVDLAMAEHLAERAGAAIGNAKLYAAANDAIRLRDDFLSAAGHELRTPLGALKLHLQAQVQSRDGTPLEKLRERGRKMLSQTSRLERLVEDLLDVSKLTNGRLVLDREDVDLRELVASVVDRVHDEAEAARCTVRVDAEPVVGRWDRGRIDQVVMNLLTNAIKYGRAQPIDISIRRDGAAAVLTVRDGGIGIALEDQPRIFGRFERAVSPRNYGGMGLGLWIAKEIVDTHDGAISVESQLGAGATFTVRLPVAES